MHGQIVPVFLLIVWVTVLLTESMVEAVRLYVRVFEFDNVDHQFDTV